MNHGKKKNYHPDDQKHDKHDSSSEGGMHIQDHSNEPCFRSLKNSMALVLNLNILYRLTEKKLEKRISWHDILH